MGGKRSLAQFSALPGLRYWGGLIGSTWRAAVTPVTDDGSHGTRFSMTANMILSFSSRLQTKNIEMFHPAFEFSTAPSRASCISQCPKFLLESQPPLHPAATLSLQQYAILAGADLAEHCFPQQSTSPQFIIPPFPPLLECSEPLIPLCITGLFGICLEGLYFFFESN